MSTLKSNNAILQKLIIDSVLDTTTIPLLESLKFLLALKRYSISDIAKKADVSRQAVYDVINGQYDSIKVKQAITEALGFNPWS